MKNITFEQFLLTYNFRLSDGTQNSDGAWNSQTIRVHIPQKDLSYDTSDWFEFGIYHFDRGVDILKRIRKIFNEDILKSYVYSIRTLDLGILFVELSYEKDLDMD